GRADMVTWRPSTGQWSVLTSSSGFTYGSNYSNCIVRQWGAPEDIPIQNSDFDGDGLADMVTWRPSIGQWSVLTSSSGFHYRSNYSHCIVRQWGAPEDIPTQHSDFDGDGKADMATWRPSIGQWSVLTSKSGFDPNQALVRQLGTPEDIPIQSI